MAPDVLLALVAAEVVLWGDGRRLRYRAPVGALDARLKAAAGRVRGSLLALVRAGAVLPVERGAWPAEAVEELEERAGMLIYDAGLPPSQAEREAERLVRVSHARAFVGRAALVHFGSDESVDPLADEAVAIFHGRGVARTGAP